MDATEFTMPNAARRTQKNKINLLIFLSHIMCFPLPELKTLIMTKTTNVEQMPVPNNGFTKAYGTAHDSEDDVSVLCELPLRKANLENC